MYIILIFLKFNFFVRHSDPEFVEGEGFLKKHCHSDPEFVEGEESLANARIVSDKLRDPSSASWRPPAGGQDDSRVYPRESGAGNF